ncbi:hypothetical protein GCM10027020_20480 [Nocardioides salsibiostraticola]
MAWLVSHVPGVTAKSSNTFSQDRSQEIDVSFWVDPASGGLPDGTSGVVFGECKNWSRKIDSSDIAWFDWKMKLGGVASGVIFAKNGMTQHTHRLAAAESIVVKANQEGRTIYVLTLDEVESLTSVDDLRNLLIDKKLLIAAQAPFR